ncbi:MAG: hypothetical protein RR931_01655 [Mucinivorans sp.]
MEYQSNQEYPEYNDYPQEPQNANAQKGLIIAIAILLIVLGAVSFLYWRSVERAKVDEEALKIEMDTLTSRLGVVMGDMSILKFDNDTLNQNLETERHKADSLMTKLKKERNISYAKFKAYERELGTLRTAMQGFVRQIDSLNTLNKKLVGENLGMRRELSSYRTRTEAAEEKASELNSKVKRGEIIRARDISLRAVSAKDKDVNRAKQAKRLITTFILAANDLATPGERTVYVRIIGPQGYDMLENQGTTFSFEGRTTAYTVSRAVDYQNEDLSVSVYYNGGGIEAGSYTVMVYMDDYLVGQNMIILK